MADTLYDKLGMPTSPQRPFEDDGVVLGASAAPLEPLQVWSQCEDLIAAHLARVCTWPEEARGHAWQAGDYSYYILEYAPEPGVRLFVQLWSEPGEKVLMEVCSPEANPDAAAWLAEPVREALAARGFRPGGEAGNFLRALEPPAAGDTRMLAREALSALTDCLGYDGRQPLNYVFCLGRRDSNAGEAIEGPTALLRAVTLDELETLLTSAGHTLQPLQAPAQGFLVSTGAVAYSAVLVSPQAGRPGCFGAIQLSAFAPVPQAVAQTVVSRLALELPCGRLGIDTDGDLALMQTVVVDGGITRDNLALQFGFWQQNLDRVRQALVQHARKAVGVVLH